MARYGWESLAALLDPRREEKTTPSGTPYTVGGKTYYQTDPLQVVAERGPMQGQAPGPPGQTTIGFNPAPAGVSMYGSPISGAPGSNRQNVLTDVGKFIGGGARKVGGVVGDVVDFAKENPALVTGVLGAGASVYGAHKEGQARDRDIESRERLEKDRIEQQRKRDEDERMMAMLRLMMTNPGGY